MNTSALKSFAPAVRRQLMEAVTRKLDYVLTADTPDLRTAAAQVKSLRQEAERDRAALVERVAYTWFNRLAAIRFLDARGWHPFHARVLTPATAEETQPELLKLTRTGSLPPELAPHTDPGRLNDLLDGKIPSPDSQTEVYRHLILATCRFYHDLLPDVFAKLNDEMEFLLPDDLLTATSVAEGFRTEISDDDCSEVELLGWLYQFYISERKDTVMARKSAVPTEDIPAVTQLFTPHWIVRYLVENSLGRLWLLNRPNSKLREHMPYYIEGDKGTNFLRITKPEDIRLLDPAVGSGHMLTYAFDLLFLIYQEEGYAPTEIPALILRHNLHGLEICPRAAQLAELALVFKARHASRRFFQPEHFVRPNIIELREVRFAENELPMEWLVASDQWPGGTVPGKAKILHDLHLFTDAKNFGSLLQPRLSESQLGFLKQRVTDHWPLTPDPLFSNKVREHVLRVLEQAEALTQRYHVVVANPPYMGGGNMDARTKLFLETNYEEGKADLFSAFIMRCMSLAVKQGCVGMITMHGWMFLPTFKQLRPLLRKQGILISMCHLGPRGFDTISGEVVQTTAFVFAGQVLRDLTTTFHRLVAGNSEEAKRQQFLSGRHIHKRALSQFLGIETEPLIYWLPEKALETFATNPVSKNAKSGGRCKTHNDVRFVRCVWETQASDHHPVGKWKFLEHGGEFRKWFGNRQMVFNWSPEAKQVYADSGGLSNRRFWDKAGISWSDIGSGPKGFRLKPDDSEYSSLSPTLIPNSTQDLFGLLALLNTSLASQLVNALNPSIHVNVGDALRLPYAVHPRANRIGEECVALARADWDNFETAWDFRDQPLLRNYAVRIMNDEGKPEAEADSDFILHHLSFIIKGATLQESWNNWKRYCDSAIHRMRELETENNRLFIAAYGLDGELQPEVPEEQITLARADVRKDMAAFLSYAVGCMMGRYSLDHTGLILADAGATVQDYLAKVPKPTFAPDEDGILPMLDGEWFTDDVVARTREFLKVIWGAEHLDENVAWLEQVLGKVDKKTGENKPADLRTWFVRDFYKNHLSNERAYGYKKRPIYWLVSSPGGSFQALIYLHRYTKDTVNTILNSYLREFIHKLDARQNHLVHVESTSTNAREKTAARKEADKLRKSLKECQDWEREVVLPLAQQRIEIDLDDGVKANYLKFPGFLAKIPGLEKKEEE